MTEQATRQGTRVMAPVVEGENRVVKGGGRTAVGGDNVVDWSEFYREPKAHVIDWGSEDDAQTSVMKAFMGQVEPSASAVDKWHEARGAFEEAGALSPLYDKDLLIRRADQSGALQECIQVYVRVIEGYGHMFEPVLDPDVDDAREQVRMSLWMERRRDDKKAKPPTEEEVDEKVEELKNEIRFQQLEARRFFNNCARDEDGRPISMIALRQLLRRDYETTGEAFVEILRDDDGNIRRLHFIPSVGIRKFPKEKRKIEITGWERVDDFQIEEVDEWRSFRRLIQVDPYNHRKVYFKEFGDPRVYSQETGRMYPDEDALHREEDDPDQEPPHIARPANELYCWKQHHPMSSYGVPRWIANSPLIVGMRKAEEVNTDFFDAKGIPPAVVLVSGGRLASDASEKIKNHLRSIKGSNNFHKVLVLEAMPFNSGLPGQTPHRTQLEWKTMMDKLPQDATHLEYMNYGDTRIGANFSTPPILRGRSEEYTRATARAALMFFVEMVARPEQHLFDSSLNSELMMEMGLSLIKFKSRGPDTSDAELFSKLLDVLLKHGVIVPAEARSEAERLLGRNLQPNTEEWAKSPLAMTLAGIKGGDPTRGPDNVGEGGNPSPPSAGDITPTPGGSGPGDVNPGTAKERRRRKSSDRRRVGNVHQRLKRVSNGDITGRFGMSGAGWWTSILPEMPGPPHPNDETV